MSSDPLLEVILLAVLVAAHAFITAAQVAVDGVRKTRLRQLAEEGSAEARTVERLAEDSSRFLATIQVWLTLIGFIAAATAAVNLGHNLAEGLAAIPVPFIQQSASWLSVVLITVVLAFIMLIFGELVPKTVAMKYTEQIALNFGPILDLLAHLTGPIVRVLVYFSNGIARMFGATHPGTMPFVTEDEIKTIVDAGEEGGVIEEDEKEMIYSIFDFGDTLAREVMVPRIDIVALDIETPVNEAVDTILHAGHSRIPVYTDQIDNIIGVLYAKDLLQYYRGRSGAPGGDGASAASPRLESLRDLIRPAYFVPEATKIDQLLEELQQRRVHMAIVVDEYGGVAGLVTIEDILEEIVGEIQDEYDVAEEPAFEQVGPDEYIFSGRTDLNDVNDVLHTELSKEQGDTLGGLIYALLGKVPSVGERIQVDDLELEVLQVAQRRIKKVRVKHLARPGEPPGEPFVPERARAEHD